MSTFIADERQALEEELAEARALVERDEARAALKLLERIRRVSLAEEQVPALEQVLALGELISRGAEGKLQDEAERLLYSARQNIRFIGYKRALAEERGGGVDWFEPPIGRPVSVSDATVGDGDRLGWRRPRYERRVWLKWLGLTVLVFVPAGALFGLLMPVLEYGVFPRVEPPPANWDSPGELAKMVPVGIWLLVVPWTGIYFERVNTRYRSVDGGHAGSKAPGYGLAVTALVLAICFFLARDGRGRRCCLVANLRYGEALRARLGDGCDGVCGCSRAPRDICRMVARSRDEPRARVARRSSPETTESDQLRRPRCAPVCGSGGERPGVESSASPIQRSRPPTGGGPSLPRGSAPLSGVGNGVSRA